MLKLEGVSLTRARRRILNGVDLEVAQGDLRFLVGSSGSGKTTILRIAAGLDLPDRGSVTIAGTMASTSRKLLVPPHARGIGMVFQDGALWDHMTVEQHLRFAVNRNTVDPQERDRRVQETLSLVGLTDRRTERPGHLSGGERQRVGLARALVGRPRLLLLDEPLAHVDFSLQRELAEKLARITEQHGITTLWVTHRPGEVAFVGGAVAILRGGRIVKHVEPDDVPEWIRTVGY